MGGDVVQKVMIALAVAFAAGTALLLLILRFFVGG